MYEVGDSFFESLSESTNKAVTRKMFEDFFKDYDFNSCKKFLESTYSTTVLNPEEGKMYDSEIETYSYLVKIKNVVSLFQSTVSDAEGLNFFETDQDAMNDAQAWVDRRVNEQVESAFFDAFFRSVS